MDQVCQEMKIQRPAFGGNKVLKAIEKVSPTKETVCRVHSKTPEGADKLTPVCLKRRKKATRNSLLDKIHKVSAKSIAFDTFALTEDEDVTKTAAGPTLTVQTPDKSGGRKQDTPSQSEGYEQENLEKKRLMRNVCKLTSPDEATEVDQKHRRRRRERRISINFFKHSQFDDDATHTFDVCSTGKKRTRTNSRQMKICALQRMFCF